MAVARPIPELPPVITATLPSKSLFILGRITTSHALEQALHSHAAAHASWRSLASGTCGLYSTAPWRNPRSPVPGAAVVVEDYRHRARGDGFNRRAGVSFACGENPARGRDGLHRAGIAAELQTTPANLVHSLARKDRFVLFR